MLYSTSCPPVVNLIDKASEEGGYATETGIGVE